MNKKYIYAGVISIASLVAFIGLFIAAITVSASGLSISTGFFKFFESKDTFAIITTIIAIVAAISAILLLIVTVLKFFKPMKALKLVEMILAVILLVTAILTIVFTFIIAGDQATAGLSVFPGAGAWMIAVGGVVAGVTYFVQKFLVKE